MLLPGIRSLYGRGGYARSILARGLRGWMQGRSDPIDRGSLQTYCCFIGYPRSGHSLVGALLNAHPDMVISHELDALRFVRLGVGANTLYRLIVSRDEEFVGGGASWSGYDYSIAGGWQGRSRELRVIGDKKGGATARQCISRPELLTQLESTVDVPVRYVHVTRNPLDNIATIARRNRIPVAQATRQFFQLVDSCQIARQRIPTDRWLDMAHEELISDPRASLTRLARFLEVEPEEPWIEACAAHVFSAPRRTRSEVDWEASVREEIAQGCARYPFLARYVKPPATAPTS